MNLTARLLFLISFVILLAGCSGGSQSIVTSQLPGSGAPTQSMDTLPVLAFDGESAIGIMGGYNLTLDPNNGFAELVPMRSAAEGESFIVSGKSFFAMSPCVDCLKINNIALNNDGLIELGFIIKHPFEKGDPFKPPSALNRLDLDVFDLALLVKPIDVPPVNWQFTGTSSFPGILMNADGYTKELTEVTGNPEALPYKISYESENYNRFEMGTEYQDFMLLMNPGESTTFNLYLTMGYGASAIRAERLVPNYYIPEFNRKAAWKVEVTPPEGDEEPLMGNTWNDMDTSTEFTVTIDVYDWNHGVEVDPDFPDRDNRDKLSASSDVTNVTVEVPGMTGSIVTAQTDDTTSNGWDDPLTYTASFANENQLTAGEYYGLVKVTDSRVPGQTIAGGEPDTLVHTPDGILLEWMNIPEFATYQVFTATVVIGADPPEIESIVPSSGVLNSIVTGATINGTNFDSDAEVFLTLSTGGTPVYASHVEVDPAGTSLTCTIDLDETYFELGFYDVSVRNPQSNLSDTLLEGFEVIEGLQIMFESEVKPFDRPVDEHWDEFSPAITQDPNGQIVAFWHNVMPNPNQPDPPPDPPDMISGDIPGRSHNGLSWSGGTNVFGTGGSSPPGEWRFDVLKMAPRANFGAFVLINFVTLTSTALATDQGVWGGGYSFRFVGRSWNFEVMSDANGYGYYCGDRNGNIHFFRSLSPNSTSVPADPSNIAPGRLSKVRSWGIDSDGLLYLAFTDTALTNIQLTHGTTDENTTWASPTTIFDDTGYTDIRDPGMHIRDDVIYLIFVRHNSTSNEYELCFMRGDLSFNFSTPQVVQSSSDPFDDAHIQSGEFFGYDAVGIAYQNSSTVYFTYSSNDGAVWTDPIVVQETTMPTESCDMIFLERTGSLQQDVIIIWAEERDNGLRDIKTRMAHFID